MAITQEPGWSNAKPSTTADVVQLPQRDTAALAPGVEDVAPDTTPAATPPAKAKPASHKKK